MAVSSSRCVPFLGRSDEPRARRSPGRGCGRPLDRVAGWVGGGIAAAFFASLERCQCVNVRTHDDLDDERRDSEAPLMADDGDGAGAGRRRRSRGRGKRSEQSRRGGGFGCYG